MALRASARILSTHGQIVAGAPACTTALAASISTTSKNCFSSSSPAFATGGIGDKVATSIETATGDASGVEKRSRDAGFVPSPNASPDIESAGKVGGPGASAMGDLADMADAVFHGDSKRAGEDIRDMTRTGEGANSGANPPHTISQDWPREGLQPAGSSSSGAANTPTTSEGDVVDKYEGTIPSSSPPGSPPDIDQNPPENVTAGPTGGYSARGGDNRAV